MDNSIIKLSDRVVVRKEHFGGMLFNKDTGDIVEIDREAYTIISIIRDVEIVEVRALLELPISFKGKRIKRQAIKVFLSTLYKSGFITILPNGVISDEYKWSLSDKSLTKVKWPSHQILSAPETVHWAVTYKCGESCLDCYIERYKDEYAKELDSKEALALVDKIANKGVFQLAIGGGEPFNRIDLEDIVNYADQKGLIVHITTGRYEIEPSRLDKLAKSIKTLQVGIRLDRLLDNSDRDEKLLSSLVTSLNERGIIAGANLIMTRSAINELDRVIRVLVQCGFKRYTLLRYKPPSNIKRWLKEKPDNNDLFNLEDSLIIISEKYEEVSIRIDCALSFLERKLPKDMAVSSGIRGCVAGDRILSIAADGSVYPCSQLVGDSFYAGDFLRDNVDEIWYNSDVLRKYRAFRSRKSFKYDNCGKCKAKSFCGGCRVFSDDATGFDKGCPDPKYESKYCDEEYNMLLDIQDSIGHTDAGFPYATFEDIEGWLEEEDDRNYPLWMRNNK